MELPVRSRMTPVTLRLATGPSGHRRIGTPRARTGRAQFALRVPNDGHRALDRQARHDGGDDDIGPAGAASEDAEGGGQHREVRQHVIARALKSDSRPSHMIHTPSTWPPSPAGKLQVPESSLWLDPGDGQPGTSPCDSEQFGDDSDPEQDTHWAKREFRENILAKCCAQTHARRQTHPNKRHTFGISTLQSQTR